MFPHIKVELRAEDKFFGPGVCELLELIEQTGSLQSACTEMGLSYSKGSRMLRGIERQLGVSAVHRWTGGAGGGGGPGGHRRRREARRHGHIRGNPGHLPGGRRRRHHHRGHPGKCPEI